VSLGSLPTPELNDIIPSTCLYLNEMQRRRQFFHALTGRLLGHLCACLGLVQPHCSCPPGCWYDEKVNGEREMYLRGVCSPSLRTTNSDQRAGLCLTSYSTCFCLCCFESTVDTVIRHLFRQCDLWQWQSHFNSNSGDLSPPTSDLCKHITFCLWMSMDIVNDIVNDCDDCESSSVKCFRINWTLG